MKKFEELLNQVSAAAAEKVANKTKKIFELAKIIIDEFGWDSFKEFYRKSDESQIYLGFDRKDPSGSRTRTNAAECYLVVDTSGNGCLAIDTGRSLETTEPTYHRLRRIYEEDIVKSIQLSNDWFNQWKGLFDRNNRIDEYIINNLNYHVYSKLIEHDQNIKTLFKSEKEFRESEFGFNLSTEAKVKVDEIMEYLISEAEK